MGKFGMGWVIDGFNYAIENPIIIFLFVIGYLALFAFSLWFSSRPQKRKNPFASDVARAPEPLVTDEKERIKVIKEGFNVKKLPDKVDAIIIGSGIGGLTTANILAKAGLRVLVLEQHDQAGGCCHTFIDKGFEFDVGIHYIGEMRNNTISKLLISQMTEGQLVWEDIDDIQDIVAIGEPGKASEYPICTGKAAWRAALVKSFPKEEKAIDRFLELIMEVRKNMLGVVALKMQPMWLAGLLAKTGLVHLFTKYFKYSSRTLEEVLDELTDNKDLKAVLGYSFGDYGTVPKETSFAMHATLVNHYLYGGSYPRGGASEIAFHLIPPILRAGGKVLVRAAVKEIIINESGRAIGVKVEKSGGVQDLYSRLIISDAGIPNTFCNLLPPEIAQKSRIFPLLNKKIRSGIGAMSLFVGLRGTKEELGLKAQNVWAFTGNELSEKSLDYLYSASDEVLDAKVPLLFISFPSTKDSTFNDRYPGKSVCTVVTLANWDWFKDWENDKVTKRGDDYDRIKNSIRDRMWEQVLAFFPHLEDKVEFMDIGSPVSNKYYIAAPRGEIYGLDHNVDRFGSPEIVATLRPETDIPGLMLTGQDVFNCGFMGAAFGGLLCASKILNRDLWSDLVELKKSIAKNK